MIRTALCLALGLTFASAAAAAEPGGGTMTIVTHDASADELAAARPSPGRSDLSSMRVTVTNTASAEAIAAAYPEHGRGAGTVSVSCVVARDGSLSACRARNENPPGLGFGEAAAGLATQFYRAPPPPPGARAAFITFSLTISRPGAPSAGCEPPACGAIPRPPPSP